MKLSKNLLIAVDDGVFDGEESIFTEYLSLVLGMEEQDRKTHVLYATWLTKKLHYPTNGLEDPKPCPCRFCVELIGLINEAAPVSSTPHAKARIPIPTQIYAMRHRPSGLVKIGRSGNPERRERTLNAVDPEIDLLFSFPARAQVELDLHRRFADKRERGEWFRLGPEDLDLIKSLLLGAAA